MNVLKVKGTHNAMKTGMLAAECAFEALSKSSQDDKGETTLIDKMTCNGSIETLVVNYWAAIFLSSLFNVHVCVYTTLCICT